MQFQVPQFIETEDKIVGPFSLRQFAYVAAGAAVSALFYFTVQTWLWAIASIIIFALAGGLAFVKVEGRSLGSVIMSAAGFYWRPQTYIWQPDQPKNAPTESRAKTEDQSALEEVLLKAASSMKKTIARPTPLTREEASSGTMLHQAWEDVQTGAKFGKSPDARFLERKMAERYQIFRKLSGDRNVAKRVDYR